jgi:hypothetical protein
VVETRSCVPSTSSVVMVTVSPVAHSHRPAGEGAEADLRALQVDEDADPAPDSSEAWRTQR